MKMHLQMQDTLADWYVNHYWYVIAQNTKVFCKSKASTLKPVLSDTLKFSVKCLKKAVCRSIA